MPSAEQVLEQPCNEDEPGCILLDVRMPGLSGLELQSSLLELGSILPILFLSGHSDVEHYGQGHQGQAPKTS
ncbi:response regulator [Bradyrhizobium betae]